MQETPYSFATPSDLAARTSCEPKRGANDAPLFLVNHWLTPVGPAGIVLVFLAASGGAWVFTEVLVRTDVISPRGLPSPQLTLFISRPDALSIVVAVLAGIAGALAITLPDARGLVGVFVSITTIPAAANIGVAVVNRDGSEAAGAAVQLLVNVLSLLLAGVATLEFRRRIGPRLATRDREPTGLPPG